MSERLYFDSSALVKLYIVEPGSEAVQTRSHQAAVFSLPSYWS